LKTRYRSEAALCEAAAEAARCWRDSGESPLIVGLSGELGAGKTTWVRSMLRGLGHKGRVPSPTFTLLEHYELDALTVVHLDLYRLAEPRELDFLGLRDWLGLPLVWLLVEWPERGGDFQAALDLRLVLTAEPDQQRWLETEAISDRGHRVLRECFDSDIK
jgi:tRNA threonylcarbamoyladenosine biosynthesis protein TsaE